jgi:hypothetical protein
VERRGKGRGWRRGRRKLKGFERHLNRPLEGFEGSHDALRLFYLILLGF